MKLRDSWIRATAPLRPWPDFVIIGAQRCGTTSLHSWLCSHPNVAPPAWKELHYFDDNYRRGEWWYRSRFPLHRSGTLTGESTPFLLFHPLAPERAARDLPATTRFIVLLRDPVERALSHYWYSRARHLEPEPLARAIELEQERTSGEMARLSRGEVSRALHVYSYVARGEYAGQLDRWFDAVSRERVLVLPTEELQTERSRRAVTDWLGLPPALTPFPVSNRAERGDDADTAAVVARLRAHFEPHDRALFELLGVRLWESPHSSF